MTIRVNCCFTIKDIKTRSVNSAIDYQELEDYIVDGLDEFIDCLSTLASEPSIINLPEKVDDVLSTNTDHFANVSKMVFDRGSSVFTGVSGLDGDCEEDGWITVYCTNPLNNGW